MTVCCGPMPSTKFIGLQGRLFPQPAMKPYFPTPKSWKFHFYLKTTWKQCKAYLLFMFCLIILLNFTCKRQHKLTIKRKGVKSKNRIRIEIQKDTKRKKGEQKYKQRMTSNFQEYKALLRFGSLIWCPFSSKKKKEEKNVFKFYKSSNAYVKIWFFSSAKSSQRTSNYSSIPLVFFPLTRAFNLTIIASSFIFINHSSILGSIGSFQCWAFKSCAAVIIIYYHK